MMTKTKQNPLPWVDNLRTLMVARGLNPRSLSLKAGLNATAVRDMMEGRTKFPRYDTAQNLAVALEVTPHQLMGEVVAREEARPKTKSADLNDDNLDLLTEIIARLQEVAAERRHQLEPRDFAAMVTTLFSRVQTGKKQGQSAVTRHDVEDLLSYEVLRKKAHR